MALRALVPASNHGLSIVLLVGTTNEPANHSVFETKLTSVVIVTVPAVAASSVVRESDSIKVITPGVTVLIV